MNDDQFKQAAMCGTVDRFIDDNADAINAIEATRDEAADVKAANAKLVKVLPKTVLTTTEVTRKAEEAERKLRVALPALLGPLSSIATKAKDVDLLAKATLRVKQLEKLSPPQLAELADQMLTLAEAQPAATLGRYGLDQVLPILRPYHQTLAKTVGQTQDLIDDRSNSNRSAGELLRDTLQQVYELDKVMLVFKLLNPDLYKAYQKARRVGKARRGKKKGKKGDKPQG